jgi:hypothetical protein
MRWRTERPGSSAPAHLPQASWARTAPSHLLAVSLDSRRLPVALFTDGHWFDAATTLTFVDRFALRPDGEHAASARWIFGVTTMPMDDTLGSTQAVCLHRKSMNERTPSTYPPSARQRRSLPQAMFSRCIAWAAMVNIAPQVRQQHTVTLRKAVLNDGVPSCASNCSEAGNELNGRTA